MKTYKILKINGALLDKQQLEQYLEKVAANHNLKSNSNKDTYPVPRMIENYEVIKETYNLLNEHLKLGIGIHPAGEWILDNFYIIEEAVKSIEKELTIKKYTDFVGLQNGQGKGFARIYVLAAEIVAYTDNKIERESLEKYLQAYQTQKTLSMDEIWNIGIFLQIAIIENIREICEKIKISQMQKYKAESIVERLVELKEKNQLKFKNSIHEKSKIFEDMKLSFIEYISYILKRYGKKANSYLMALEEEVEKTGTTVSDVIKKEHFDIAVKKVSIGNSITSIKTIIRINFLEIFEKINGVEEILKSDPAKVYENMDFKTKEYYRNAIKEISKKTKISEIYIAKKILELANKEEIGTKKSHIGYYLIDEGINILYNVLHYKNHKKISNKQKTQMYIVANISLTILISIFISLLVNSKIKSAFISILTFLILLIPISELIVQIIQYILSKITKPKIIPKLDFSNGIDKKNTTIVVIPTIIKTKEKVKELMRKLEVYYLANKSENMYFVLLGDCSESKVKKEDFDVEVEQEGTYQVKKLNEKYAKNKIPIFHFLYRERVWNESENSYLGWERKRGLLNQFNEYILGHTDNNFKINTIEEYNTSKDLLEENKIEKIKYIITLDADTDLCLNSAFELIGAMAHILNVPEIDKTKNIVVNGYGIMQPRVGVNLDISYKNLFTKIFAGAGGIDSYTNAISDIYQDNFGEGIFTGKGIYDLKVFSQVLSHTIIENTVLSHDLLEGSILRCGLATDILLMDGYPAKYTSFMSRLSRWIRGDWQIAKWLNSKIKVYKENSKEVLISDYKNSKEKNKLIVKKKNPLNLLSKYKIFDNLRRSLFEISIVVSIVYFTILKMYFNIKIIGLIYLLFIILALPFILEFVNHIIFKQEGEKKQKVFTPKIDGLKGALYRGILTIGCLPYKAYNSLLAIIKTIYRVTITHKNLLEWTTSEEAEKLAKSDYFSYYRLMFVNIIFGIIALILAKNNFNIMLVIIGILWIIIPAIMCFISKEKTTKNKLSELSNNEQEYMKELGQKTWNYFKENLNEENNYLIPDNYQEDRKNLFVDRTSSTNIGLSLLAVISSYDLGYEKLQDTITLLTNMINSIDSLQKWNGHLYNWYNIKTKEPLIPRYISTVDSGNFVGYLYVVKSWLEEINKKKNKEEINKEDTNKEDMNKEDMNKEDMNKEDMNKEDMNKEDINKEDTNIDNTNIEITNKGNIGNENKGNMNNESVSILIDVVNKMIEQTNFKPLYSEEQRLFSIGFNVEENKLTDSYYDLLASESRQASLVAIAKKDVPVKHWNSLSRALTTINKYKGLISWSGTAFEYFMPNINIPKYSGSLLDETCKFVIMTQMQYCKKLGIPWGVSESAFNVKDLHSNYQYKAFGIPWIGLKRGLADEMVISSYGSILAINEVPKEVYKNLKILEEEGMYNKYGFYESIDYTPSRLNKGEKASIVKTYMAHHQGLILLSINNLFNNNVLQKRFIQNPEIEAVSILLQERMPETFIITKENKEKVEKLKYKDYENYIEQVYNKIDDRLIRGNVISNEQYTVAMNQKGIGVSIYKDIYINRFKKTDDYAQGIFFYVKNIKNNKIWSSNYNENIEKTDKYQVSFMPDKNKIERIDGNIKTKMQVSIAPDEPVEIRRLELENIGNEEELLEVTSYFEPVLSKKEQDYSHQAFNNLFLISKYDENLEALIVKRKKRAINEKEMFLGVQLLTDGDTIGDIEYEIDKEKFLGRGNIDIPKMIKNSIPLSKKQGLVTEQIIAIRRSLKIKPNQKVYVDLVIAVNENKESVITNLEKYKNSENIKRALELSKARVEAENRYLGVKGKDIIIYQKMLSYIIFDNPLRKQNMEKIASRQYSQSELWKYGISGDYPIILVQIKDANDIYVVEQVIKAYEFFRTKNIEVELVILDEEKYSYENYVKEEIESAILNNNLSYMKNIRGGIFVLSKNEINKQDINLLKFLSTISINAHLGELGTAIQDFEEDYIEKYKEIGQEKENINIIEEQENNIDLLSNIENLKYYNEYGAFSEDGQEYIIKINRENRLPAVWCHILANEKIGTVITENMGGYSWYKNSRLNRISVWNNTSTLDIPSEIIYLKDMENKKAWSLGASPMPDNQNYNVVYGFGYAKYIHESDGIIQELEVFVPKEDSVKINILKLKNTTPNKKKIKIVYYIKPVIGEDEIKSNEYINLKYEENNNIVCANNLYCTECGNNTIYVSSSEKIKSYTGDKKFFLGRGGLTNPDGLKKVELNNDSGIGKNSCIAVEFLVEIESFENKEISLLLGAEENEIDVKNIAYKYSKISNCNLELANVKNYWRELLGKVNVVTPLESMNIILNGWVMYQTIVSRLIGRSGFYQSGGAYGYRDQLQDTLATKYLNPEIMKNQIIKHSAHQFLEGDVEHWWHDENKRGIRTRFSDDLLWLVYLTIEYINFTGDYSILDVKTPYLKGNQLEENEDEKYDIYETSDISEEIYEHCIKAINKSLNFGENGMPKIGSGDWNDGFNTVGNKGKGESVWLGFFLYKILDGFIDIMKWKVEHQKLDNVDTESIIKDIERYEAIMQQLKKTLNTNAWDGRWYKRAFTDDGQILGSMENDECRIDSIAQSWSVISNAGDNDKKYISMESLENHLVDRENGIIKLLDPPFEKGKLEPGYIKAYLPGVRENGGQYTHAAMWVIIAETMLGFGDKALELYRMLNPIEHSRTKDSANKYKVEPYVIPADIYGANNLAGRGGWTWYTGSSSWFYKVGIEYILGLTINKNVLSINPCIPRDWKEYNIRYKFGKSIYNIKVNNLNGKNTGVQKVLLNEKEVENAIALEDNGKVYRVEVYM